MDIVDEIKKHYESELNSYKYTLLPKLNESIISERALYNTEIDGLLNFYLLSLYLLDNSKIYFTEPAKFSLNFIFTKTATDIISLHQCLSIGQKISSSYIIRSIFETYVDLKIISIQDSELRMKLYQEFQIITKWNHYCNYKNYIAKLVKSDNHELLEEVQENFDRLFNKKEIAELKVNYKNISCNYHPKKPYHWAWSIFKGKLNGRKLTLKFICEEIGLYNDYLQIYSSTSIATHNDPLTINLLIKNGNATPSPNFSKDTKIYAALGLNFTVEIYLIIFKLINSPKYYELEMFLNYLYHKHIGE